MNTENGTLFQSQEVTNYAEWTMPRMSSKGYAPIAARAGTESPINVHFAKIDGHHHPTLTLSRPRPPVPPRYYYTYCIVYRMGRILVKVSC